MKSIQHLFADITAIVEDMHALAVDGQAPDLTPDIQSVLATSLLERQRQVAKHVQSVQKLVAPEKPT